ncbi:MAG: PQQ-binding-like beta-propeller repeat protein [Candidatus Eremiobacteraeota bacterium]|nr:PQQ-binding-like beta-propeller repeat protein [Candidatus Eremiobacteraeota bacterium]
MKPASDEKDSRSRCLALLSFLLIAFTSGAGAETLEPGWISRVGGPVTLLSLTEQGIILAGSSHSYDLTAFNSAVGQPLWVRRIGAPPQADPTITSRVLLLKPSTPTLVSLRVDSGDLLWSQGPSSPQLEGPLRPTYDSEAIYAVNERGWFNRLTLDGKLTVSFRLPINWDDRFLDASLVNGAFLYVASERGEIWKVATKNPRQYERYRLGELALRQIGSAPAGNFPSRHNLITPPRQAGGQMALMTLGGELCALTLEPPLTQGWRLQVADSQSLYSPDGLTLCQPVLSENLLVVATRHQVLCLDPRTANLRWVRHFDSVASPVALTPNHEGVAVVADRSLRLLDSKSGNDLADLPVSATPTAGPVAANNLVVLGTQAGDVMTFKIGRPDQKETRPTSSSPRKS